MNDLSEKRQIPSWAEDLRQRYLRGEASMFVLHGNVFDMVVHDGLKSLSEFLTDILLSDTKQNIIVYNLATGGRFVKCTPGVHATNDLMAPGTKEKALTEIESLLVSTNKTAVVLEYADALAPAGDVAFQSDADRAAIISLHRWSFVPAIANSDNLVVLITENLSELSPKLVSNPRVAVVNVPMPSEVARKSVVQMANPQLTDIETDRYSAQTAGLKAIQIMSIFAPTSQANGASENPTKTGLVTKKPPTKSESLDTQANPETDRMIANRKREILERECFGLVEFVEPVHGFEVVGGMEGVKSELIGVAENIREGRVSRVPMGMLFTGPMGTGKTFVAEAFAKECGLTTIKLKNFRSKWVGATEGNLEKILGVIKAIGQVVVIIDEGDRAFGGTDDDGDGGTSSRVIARIKEFMSDTSNRGRILFLLMTNRPDKLDSDIKRAGRLDRKIPFLYSQTPQEVEAVVTAQLRKNDIVTKVDFQVLRADFSQKLVGYSNADVEAVMLLANDLAAHDEQARGVVEKQHFLAAVSDYFPSRDIELLEYMELLAVFEASSRRLLPPKYASMTPEEMDTRLRILRATVANRR